MIKKTALVLAAALLWSTCAPVVSLAWYSRPPGPYYNYRVYDHPRYYGHGHHHDDAWLWFGGILLGTLFLSTVLQPPPPEQRVYYQQQPQVIYNYPPYVPPGMCRWERYVRDGYGRFVLDQYGQPIKEYTIGSCQFPPN